MAQLQNHFAEHVRWQFGWPQGVSDPFSHWNIDFLKTTLQSQVDAEDRLLSDAALAPIAAVWQTLKAGPMQGHLLLRCYANAHTYGVEGYPHTDTLNASQIDNYTAVLYLNPVWKKEWAGELVVLNGKGDTICAVQPQPGRLALMPGDVMHAARGVSRQCPAVRVCLAFKTRLPTAAEQAAMRTSAGSVASAGSSHVCTTGWHLYLDPVTQRVVYASPQPLPPTRSFVFDGPHLEGERVFTAAQLTHLHHAGAVPDRFFAQNCWGFRWANGSLVPA